MWLHHISNHVICLPMSLEPLASKSFAQVVCIFHHKYTHSWRNIYCRFNIYYSQCKCESKSCKSYEFLHRSFSTILSTKIRMIF